MSLPTPDDLRPLVERVCTDMGLDAFAANTVEAWVRGGPSSWPSCCLGACDPCNDVLRAAAKRVLSMLNES